MNTIDFIVSTLAILFIGFLIIIICTPRVYCFVFEHKCWKAWHDILAMLDEFEFVETFRGNYLFIDYSRTFQIVVWRGTEASVHLMNNECVCSTFFTCYSRKVANKLMEKLKSSKTKEL